jgi:hypothetical protein
MSYDKKGPNTDTRSRRPNAEAALNSRLVMLGALHDEGGHVIDVICTGDARGRVVLELTTLLSLTDLQGVLTSNSRVGTFHLKPAQARPVAGSRRDEPRACVQATGGSFRILLDTRGTATGCLKDSGSKCLPRPTSAWALSSVGPCRSTNSDIRK